MTFPYFLPVNAPQCKNNADGTATIAYGGLASPYTDGYGTDPLWTNSLTQGMIDRRAPASGLRLLVTWTSNDKRLIVYVSQAYLEYGNVFRGQQIAEVNPDAQYYASRLRPGPYEGLLLRYRYGARQVTNVTTYGGLPLFKCNRGQLEYDFSRTRSSRGGVPHLEPRTVRRAPHCCTNGDRIVMNRLARFALFFAALAAPAAARADAPSGATPSPDETIVGRTAGDTFDANRIDAPVEAANHADGSAPYAAPASVPSGTFQTNGPSAVGGG
jgi:hypothetical protein